MQRLSSLLRIIAVIQIILGIAYLFFPGVLLASMGHTVPQSDIYYPLGMLASRFLVYGVGFFVIARNPDKHALWINLMVLIQIIDLSVGVFYTAIGIVPLSLSGFPMFNAIWISVLLVLWHPPFRRPILSTD